MTRKPYPTDLTDAQWERLEPLIPRPKSGTRKGGRPATDRREVLNAIFYHLRGGASWELLPPHFPHHQTALPRLPPLQHRLPLLPPGAPLGVVGADPRPAAGGRPGRGRAPAPAGDRAAR